MLSLQRIYRNSASEVLRVDTITMQITVPYGMNQGVNDGATYYREVRTHKDFIATDRVVDCVEILGNDLNEIDSDPSVLWATFTSPAVRVNMSDLPAVGDTV